MSHTELRSLGAMEWPQALCDILILGVSLMPEVEQLEVKPRCFSLFVSILGMIEGNIYRNHDSSREPWGLGGVQKKTMQPIQGKLFVGENFIFRHPCC